MQLVNLQYEEADSSNQAANHSCLTVHLNSPLLKGKSVDISKYTVHTDVMAPFPKQASQSDPQRVLLSGNTYASSPYPVSTQTTKVCLLKCAMTVPLLAACLLDMTFGCNPQHDIQLQQ